MSVIYHNEAFVSKVDLKNLIDNLKFQRGSFTTILIEEGMIYFLEDHLNRLKNHLKKLKIINKTSWKNVILQLISKNQAQKGSWRLKIIVSATDYLAILQKEGNILKEYKLAVNQSDIYSTSLRFKNLTNFKRVGLLKSYKQKGFDDCIMLDFQQNILEAIIANIFWIKDSTFFYPTTKLYYLHGITLSYAIKVARKMKLKIQSGKFSLNYLQGAAVFYCNSIKKICLVSSVEKVQILKSNSMHYEFIDYYHRMAKAYCCSYSELRIQSLE